MSRFDKDSRDYINHIREAISRQVEETHSQVQARIDAGLPHDWNTTFNFREAMDAQAAFNADHPTYDWHVHGDVPDMRMATPRDIGPSNPWDGYYDDQGNWWAN